MISGKYQQAEFAADLDLVQRGIGSSEYTDPVEFYRRTFITDGLRELLRIALQRFNSQGGELSLSCKPISVVANPLDVGTITCVRTH